MNQFNDDKANRHSRLADDSCRICIVIPKAMLDDVQYVAGKDKGTISSVIRSFIGEGLRNKQRTFNDGK